MTSRMKRMKRHWSRWSRNGTERRESSGCASARKAGRAAEEEVEGAVLSCHLHHWAHTSHPLASREGEHSHTGGLLSLFSLLAPDSHAARRAASSQKTGRAEAAWP